MVNGTSANSEGSNMAPLGASQLDISTGTQQQPNSVLRVIIDNMIYPVTLDVLYAVSLNFFIQPSLIQHLKGRAPVCRISKVCLYLIILKSIRVYTKSKNKIILMGFYNFPFQIFSRYG